MSPNDMLNNIDNTILIYYFCFVNQSKLIRRMTDEINGVSLSRKNRNLFVYNTRIPGK